MPIFDDLDREIRTSTSIPVRGMLGIRDPVTSEDLACGFLFRGERIPLINPQPGIFNPKEMKYLLSIKTVVPRKGAKGWNDGQRAAHDQIYQDEETIEYPLMGANAGPADNRFRRFRHCHTTMAFANIARQALVQGET